MTGLVINIKYDSSVDSCPHEAQFKATVAGVVKYYESHFSDPITINIHVGWGEVDGFAIGNGDGAASVSNYTTNRFSFSQIKAALRRDGTTGDDHNAVASLTSDFTHGGTFSMTRAEAKALGLLDATSTAVDGWIGVDKTSHWVYNTTNTTGSNITGDKVDLFSFIAHEISEVMGRQMNFGHGSAGHGEGVGYYPMDLFDFSRSTGAHNSVPNVARYFSLNGGSSHINNFNTDRSGDQFDWAHGHTADSFDAFGNKGAVSGGDLRVLDVLGYNTIKNGSTAVAANSTTGTAHTPLHDALLLAQDTAAHHASHAILAVNEHGAVTYHAGGGLIEHVPMHTIAPGNFA